MSSICYDFSVLLTLCSENIQGGGKILFILSGDKRILEDLAKKGDMRMTCKNRLQGEPAQIPEKTKVLKNHIH
jgi:hypothetical protein